MGRKKGKQSGLFASKLKRSEFYAEISLHASQHNSTSRRSMPSNTIISTHDSSVPTLSRPRIEVNVNQLRGLLRERILEDRQRDASFRRATRISSANMEQANEAQSVKSEIQTMKIGWLIDYDHRATLAGIESTEILNKDNSLEKMSIRALAPVMKEYVAACGVEYMHDTIAFLSGESINILSSLCREIDDNIAYILGRHSHVRRLVLNGSDDAYQICEMEEEIDSNNGKHLTATGLLFMADPKASACAQNNDTEMVDSWEALSLQLEEDASYNTISTSDECNNLERIELRNFYSDDVQQFAQFLKKCSKLTHLSLARSLNSVTGQQILLWEDPNVTKGTGTLLDILPNLQILDLQGCQWLHFDLLRRFVERIMQKCQTRSISRGNSSSIALEMICVGGCCKYVSKQCEYLNEITNHKPLVCIRPP